MAVILHHDFDVCRDCDYLVKPKLCNVNMDETSIIGTNAGIVWHSLDENVEPMSLMYLATVTKLGILEISQAIGWLARENKINIEVVEETVLFSIK